MVRIEAGYALKNRCQRLNLSVQPVFLWFFGDEPALELKTAASQGICGILIPGLPPFWPGLSG
tara:strand:+ start:504 stop:692 length:189 start_codon:yes stop_codon:yes gene_type:complete